MAMMLSKMQPHPHGMFDFLRELIVTEDGLVLFLLGLIVTMEIIDFLSGTFAAMINPDIDYRSKIEDDILSALAAEASNEVNV